MGEVVKNLKEALNFFKLPTIEMAEEDKMFEDVLNASKFGSRLP